jgi:hypothetical protein
MQCYYSTELCAFFITDHGSQTADEIEKKEGRRWGAGGGGRNNIKKGKASFKVEDFEGDRTL